MDSEELARIARRKAKFSEHRRNELLDNPLEDKGLLSRSTGTLPASFARLREDQKYRSELFIQIKNGSHNDEMVEHGLRKLREIIVSIPSDENNLQYLAWVKDVYVYSLEFYLKHEALNCTKLESILGNLVDKVASKLDCKEYVSALILLQAIQTRNFNRAFEQLISSPTQLSHPALCMTLVESCATDNYHLWFRAMSHLAEESFLRRLLTSLPYHKEAQEQNLNVISKSYRQLSLVHITRFWFHSIDTKDLLPVISSRYAVSGNSPHTTIRF